MANLYKKYLYLKKSRATRIYEMTIFKRLDKSYLVSVNVLHIYINIYFISFIADRPHCILPMVTKHFLIPLRFTLYELLS